MLHSSVPIVPQSNIRQWLQHQNPSSFIGKPPAAPLHVTSPPQTQRNEELLERLNSLEMEHQAMLNRATTAWDERSPISHPNREPSATGSVAFPDDDEEDTSEFFVAHGRDATEVAGDEGNDYVPRGALNIAPTPQREAPLDRMRHAPLGTPSSALPAAPQELRFESCIWVGEEDDNNGVEMAHRGATPRLPTDVYANLVAEVYQRGQLMFLEERCSMLEYLLAKHGSLSPARRPPTTVGRSAPMSGNAAMVSVATWTTEESTPDVKRIQRSNIGTMTPPFVGFAASDYASFEIRRLVTLESTLRSFLESEQERLRFRDMEYPAFRRTARFTVAKLERLFLKQEKELNGLRAAQSLEAPPPLGHGVPSRRQAPESSAMWVDALGKLIDESSAVVLPLIQDACASSVNTGVHSEDLKALLEVVKLLVSEFRAVREAIESNGTHAGASSKLPPRPSGVPSPSSQQPELRGLVSSLIEQNQCLLEALEDAERRGYEVNSVLLDRLRGLSLR